MGRIMHNVHTIILIKLIKVSIRNVCIACQRGEDFTNFLRAAQLIGVMPHLYGALGLSVKGIKILTISVNPYK